MLIMAMEQAEIKVSYTGTSKTIKKDKSQEKKAEAEDNPMATRTDITDAFDSLYIGVKLFRSRTSLLVTRADINPATGGSFPGFALGFEMLAFATLVCLGQNLLSGRVPHHRGTVARGLAGFPDISLCPVAANVCNPPVAVST